MNTIDFDESKKFGKIGEQKAKKYLTNNGWIVNDLSESPDYWDKDVDFEISRDSERFLVEVKWERGISKYGNLFAEIYANRDKNTAGWLNKCQAQIMFYGDSVNEVFYVFSLKDLKKYVFAHKDELEQGKSKDYDKDGNFIKLSVGYLVPLEDFLDSCVVQIIDLKQSLNDSDT